MPASINFVRSKSDNYVKVQDQLIELITPHLGGVDWTETFGSKVRGAVNLTFFNKRKGDVLMSHGVADKNYFFRKRRNGTYCLAAFDHAFVPGPWLRDRILSHPEISMPAENVHIVGWPRLDMLQELARNRQPSERLRILWAPTHNLRDKPGREASSYPAFEQYLPELSRHFEVDVSLHPRNRTEKTPTAEKMAACDVLISDFGTTVYEAVALGKPVIFPDWLVRDGVLADYGDASPGQLFKQDIGYHPGSFDEMMDILFSGPELNDRTKQYVDRIIDPATVGKSGKIVAEQLLALSLEYEGADNGSGLWHKLKQWI